MRYKHRHATIHGQVRAIVAARSRSAAARAFEVTDRFLKEYGTPTGNDGEIATALAKPGTVFIGPLDYVGNRKYVEDVRP